MPLYKSVNGFKKYYQFMHGYCYPQLIMKFILDEHYQIYVIIKAFFIVCFSPQLSMLLGRLDLVVYLEIKGSLYNIYTYKISILSAKGRNPSTNEYTQTKDGFN